MKKYIVPLLLSFCFVSFAYLSWGTPPYAPTPGSNYLPLAGGTMTDTLTLNSLAYTALTAEPTEAVGEFYVADNDTWDPASYAGTNDYLVICTATGSPGTFLAIRDMVTGALLMESIELPNGTDQDLDTEGQISHDTDGANEANDETMRGHDGTNQFAWARKLRCFQATVISPNDLADSERDAFPLFDNNTGMVFTIEEIKAWSDTDDTSINIEVASVTNWSSPATVDAVEIATDGTGVYHATETTITDDTIAHDEMVFIDFDDTDTPGMVKVTICGWYNANID